jgi:hypothetical protein
LITSKNYGIVGSDLEKYRKARECVSMTTREPFKRSTEGSRVLYDVLASSDTYYYTVEMLGPVAMSCECRGNAEFKRHCKHMGTAEKAEQAYSQSAKIPSPEQEEPEKGQLNGDRSFSMLRK